MKVLAADGAQTQIDITVGSVSLSMLTMGVTYSYYLRRSILTAAETHNIPVVQQPPVQPTAPQGRQLLDQPTALDNMARQVTNSGSYSSVVRAQDFSTCGTVWLCCNCGKQCAAGLQGQVGLVLHHLEMSQDEALLSHGSWL